MIDESEAKEIITAEFANCKKSLKDISWDKSNKVALVDSQHQFYCYDDIVGRFYRERKIEDTEDEGKIESPRSADMILFKENSIIFIEFKNGRIDEKVKDNIKVKAVEGCLIAMYRIASKYKSDLSFIDIIKLKKSFILVFNDKKNPPPDEAAAPINRYKNHIKAVPVRFGLDIYKETFFKEVRTFTPNNFKQWLEIEGLIPGTNHMTNDSSGNGDR